MAFLAFTHEIHQKIQSQELPGTLQEALEMPWQIFWGHLRGNNWEKPRPSSKAQGREGQKERQGQAQPGQDQPERAKMQGQQRQDGHSQTRAGQRKP